MKNVLLTALCLMLGFGEAVYAAGNSDEVITQNLQKVDPRIKVKSIQAAALEGLKEVELNSGEIVYADDKGEYFLIGQLYRFSDQDGFVNLTEQKLKAQRKDKLSRVSEEQMVVFAPEGEVKAVVNIFTDVDCPYCRKLHNEVPKLNSMGVQVNYLAFPRNGKGSKAYHTMVSIWCAQGDEGRRQAMNDAKSGKELGQSSCSNPVLEQLALGQEVGVTGTPALVFEDGTLVPGYVPAARLGQMLGL